jgi:hypothetical protein
MFLYERRSHPSYIKSRASDFYEKGDFSVIFVVLYERLSPPSDFSYEKTNLSVFLYEKSYLSVVLYSRISFPSDFLHERKSHLSYFLD